MPIMEAILPALISAGANIGGGLMSAGGAAASNAQNLAMFNQQSRQQQDQFDRTNELNQWYFQKNWENQEYMSNTAYQRAMADMKAAGLNPILAYQQGGAGGGSGSQSAATVAQPSAPRMENTQAELGRAIGNAAHSAMDSYKTVYAVEAAKAQAQKDATQAPLNIAATKKTEEDTKRTASEIYKINNEGALLHEQALNAAVQNIILRHGANTARAEAEIKNLEADAKRRYGPSWLGEQGQTVEQVIRRLYNTLTSNPSPQTPSPKLGDPNTGVP